MSDHELIKNAAKAAGHKGRMTEDNDVYTLTPLGLLETALSREDAKRAMDAMELYVRRHIGLPGGIVFDKKGQAHFALMCEAEDA